MARPFPDFITFNGLARDYQSCSLPSLSLSLHNIAAKHIAEQPGDWWNTLQIWQDTEQIFTLHPPRREVHIAKGQALSENLQSFWLTHSCCKWCCDLISWTRKTLTLDWIELCTWNGFSFKPWKFLSSELSILYSWDHSIEEAFSVMFRVTIRAYDRSGGHLVCWHHGRPLGSVEICTDRSCFVKIGVLAHSHACAALVGPALLQCMQELSSNCLCGILHCTASYILPHLGPLEGARVRKAAFCLLGDVCFGDLEGKFLRSRNLYKGLRCSLVVCQPCPVGDISTQGKWAQK